MKIYFECPLANCESKSHLSQKEISYLNQILVEEINSSQLALNQSIWTSEEGASPSEAEIYQAMEFPLVTLDLTSI